MLTFLFLLVGCGNNKADLEFSKHKSINVEKEKLDPEYKKYLKVVNSYNLTGCAQFTGEDNQRCRYTILSSLQQINSTGDCLSFTGFYNKLCLKNYYEINYMCDKLENIVEKKRCLNNKYYTKALKNKEIYWCSYIDDLDDLRACKKDVQNLVKESQDNSNIKGRCSLKSLNIKCNESDKNCNIRKQLAKFSVEPSYKKKELICENISKLNNNKGVYCYNQLYYGKAIDYINTAYCNKITQDNKLKSKCIEENTLQKAIETTDINLCEKLKNDNNKKRCIGDVYLRIITRDRLKDASICNKIELDEYKKKCYDLVIKNM